MGLTIHWELQARGKRERIRGLLETAREICAMMRFDALPELEVSPVMEYDWGAFDRKDLDEGWEWSHIQAGRYVDVDPDTKKPLSRRESERRRKLRQAYLDRYGRWSRGCTPGITSRSDRPKDGFFFRVCIDNGCEPCNIALSLFGDRTMLWESGSFCKTQYAEHFVESHLVAISVLDICRAAGIKVDVSDEGDYWETRDLGVLGGNIESSRAMIENLGGLIETVCQCKRPRPLDGGAQ